MTLKIIHKNNTSAGQAPAPSDLDIGEIAVNSADAKLYIEDNDGTIQSFTNDNDAATVQRFTQAGSGAVQRTVESKLRDAVSVKDFGAVGDGTSDDTDAIQAALDSPALSVYFPSGTYKISASSVTALTSSVNNRLIFGPGIITATTQVKRALEISGDNTTIDGLSIDGNNFIGYAIVATGLNPCVQNCRIYDLNGFNNYGGIGIYLDFNGIDGGGIISGNTISNLQGVGDGTSGNGIGMQRAILVSTDADCARQVLISNNLIETVQGEEGDAIVVSAGSSAAPKNFPVTIANNAIRNWNRRAIKIAANKVTISGNFCTNPLSSNLGSLQRVIDVTAGSDIAISKNVLRDCRYQQQIGVFLDSPQTGDNIYIADNIIEGSVDTGLENLINVKLYGENCIIKGNTVSWPTNTGSALGLAEIDKLIVASNVFDVEDITWYNLSNCTNVKFIDTFNRKGGNWQNYIDFDQGQYVIDTSSGNREILLRNRDSQINDDEIIAKISCEQNDDGDPASVNASIRFAGDGSAGGVKVSLHSGGGAAPGDTDGVVVRASGRFTPTTDNTQQLGFSDARWSQVYAGTGTINTSDSREKQDAEALAEAEKRVALALKSKIKKFRYIDAVNKKQNLARLHIGVIAQEVEQAFTDEGLDPERYGLFCKDEWYELDGHPVSVEASEDAPEGAVLKDRLGIRYDELICFIIASI